VPLGRADFCTGTEQIGSDHKIACLTNIESNSLEQCIGCVEERLVLLEDGRNNGLTTFNGCLERHRWSILVFVGTDKIERLESIAVVSNCSC
jgi:hypothetical protein